MYVSNFKLYLSLIAASFIFTFEVIPQSTVKLYGIIADRSTSKPLYGVNVVIEGTNFGDATNSRGYYEVENILEGIYTVTVSHIGYETERTPNIRISRDRAVQLNISLKPAAVPMHEVEVIARRDDVLRNGETWVIDSENISRTSARNAAQLIEGVPGIEVQDAGGIAGAKKISIRGSNANQVLILLDGIKLNDELSGDTDLSTIPANIIERIEIHKSGSSQRFGSGALGGVVEITTKRNFSNQVIMNGGYASFNSRFIEPYWSGNYKRLNYLLSYSYLESRGDYPYSYINSRDEEIREDRINADLISRNLYARFNLTFGDHQVFLNAQKLQTLRGIPGKIDAWTAYARSNNCQDIIGAEYHVSSNSFRIESSLRYSRAETENSNLFPDDADIRYKRYPQYHYTYSVDSWNYDSKINYLPAECVHITTGYQYRELHFRDENLRRGPGTPLVEANDSAHGVFLHQELNFAIPRMHGAISLTPAIRYDEAIIRGGTENRRENHWSPGAGLSCTVGERSQLFLKSNIARSFRIPTFADLFYQDVRIEGNPDLLPEKGLNRNYGCGFRLIVWGELSGEVSAFRNSMENLIVWRLGSYEVFRPFNTDAEIKGTEYLLSFLAPDECIRIELGFVDLDALNKNSNLTTYDNIIPYRPGSSFKANIAFRAGDFTLGMNYRDVGIRYINEANTKYLPGYQVLDTNLYWTKLISRVELSLKLSAYNITDEHYEIVRDMPLPGREWRFGMSLAY